MALRKDLVVGCVLLLVGWSGCATRFPAWDAAARSPDDGRSAAAWVDAAIAATGGDPYAMYQDINFGYDGTWARAIRRVQPEMVDYDFRHRSEERLHVASGTFVQVYQGPGGTKRVIRQAGAGVEVFYNGERATDEPRIDASALVSDANQLFLFGPAFLRARGAELQLIDPAVEEGRRYVRVLARLRPGLGLSDGDFVVLWIDEKTELPFRVHLTLEGTARTRGAHVDTTYLEYREIAGRKWPSRFLERVRGPLRLDVHRWWLVGLDVDRGYAVDEIAGAGLTGAAARPVEPLRP